MARLLGEHGQLRTPAQSNAPCHQEPWWVPGSPEYGSEPQITEPPAQQVRLTPEVITDPQI